MTPTAAALLRVLQDEVGYPPLTAAALARTLWVTGQSPGATGPDVDQVEAALAELMTAGLVERIWRRGAGHYCALVAERPLP